MFELTFNLFSRYVSSVGSKRRYHSSLLCVDVTERDSCSFNTIGPVVGCSPPGTAFSGELPQARTVLLFDSYSGQIFPRTNHLHVISLAVLGSEMNSVARE